jgi:hypothetical protein
LSPRAARLVLRIVGTIIVLCASLGLLYNGASLFIVASGALDGAQFGLPVPYLYEAFYMLSAVCVSCYLALLLCGVQFIRLSTSLFWLFAFALIVEAALYYGTGRLWLHPVYGGSVAAATGIAEGGLMFQSLIFLPIWAPILVWAARWTLAKP